MNFWEFLFYSLCVILIARIIDSFIQHYFKQRGINKLLKLKKKK